MVKNSTGENSWNLDVFFDVKNKIMMPGPVFLYQMDWFDLVKVGVIL
jgi:hypothetical protein